MKTLIKNSLGVLQLLYLGVEQLFVRACTKESVMNSNGTNRVVRAIGLALFTFVIVLIIGYIRNLIVGGGPYVPNWTETIIITIAVGLIGYFGPTAEERKQNRQNAKDKFTKK